MLASSVLVLSALTLTGVYVKERTRIQNENSAELSKAETQEYTEAETEENASPVNVGNAVNPIAKDDALESDFGSYQSRMEEEQRVKDGNEKIEENTQESEEEKQTDTEASAKEVSAAKIPLSFSPQEGLVWPIVGKVLINYSMDKTVYFETLQQYKYNPAIMIALQREKQLLRQRMEE